MPQTKFNCKTCRRLVSIDSACCPFCNTPNEHYKGGKKQQPNETNAPQPTDVENQKTEADPMQQLKDSEQRHVQPERLKERSSKAADEEIDLETLENMYSRVPVKPAEHSPNMETASTMQDLSLTDADTDPAKKEDAFKTRSNSEETENTISSSGEVHRSPIDWEDEREKPETEYTEMFDEKGVYQANYDGYYNDTLPKIKNEIDRALANKERIILKGVFSVVAVVAIIVYLIITI